MLRAKDRDGRGASVSSGAADGRPQGHRHMGQRGDLTNRATMGAGMTGKALEHSRLRARRGVAGRGRAGGLALGAALMVLAGCGEQGADGSGSGVERADTGRSVQIVERDIEAPEVFQLTDLGLWDGRPSLGGVWIAHAEAEDPERVIIRNDDTGQFVIGALFRRERENPGPRLQVSSDAASALGMLAGQPVSLNVTALRRQELPPAAAPSEAPAVALAAAPDADADAAAPVALAGATAEAPADMAGETAAADEPPRRRGLAALFGRRDTAPDAAPAAEDGAGIVTTAIEGRPIDDITPTAARADEATAARPAAEASPAAGAAPPAAAQRTVAAPAPSPAAAAPATASGGGIDRPFVQIGIFSVEANAERAAGMLRAEGLAPSIRREEHRGQASWRVVAGPAASEAERTRLMAAVRRLGFEDAYAVRR